MSTELPTGDVSDEVVAFAIDNYQTIVDRIPEMCSEFFRGRKVIDLLPKYEKGRTEHGTLTQELVTAQDWQEHGEEEITDLFWYTALHLFSQALNGEE